MVSTSQLTPEMFDNKEHFGLTSSQMRSRDDKLAHNGGWYNRDAVKLGWGDLSVQDFVRIAAELPDGELFIVLDETSSHWKFVEGLDLDELSPGQKYIADHCMYIISHGRFYRTPERGREGGLTFEALTREQINALISG